MTLIPRAIRCLDLAPCEISVQSLTFLQMPTISEKNQAPGSVEFLSGDGEMARLMRGHDWSQSSLGSPENWPQPLRTAVRSMLTTGHPMYIWWGRDGACLYNDAYRSSIGPERHPCSLGRPAREVWDEIWEIIGPQIDQVMTGGPATWHENQLVPITRNGRRENVYWTYSFGPIDDPGSLNEIGGVLVICTETTATVMAERRSPNRSPGNSASSNKPPASSRSSRVQGTG